MVITFENENDVIVYALEKIICYARKHQYIFVAQSVWWIASVIGLTDGLVIHIDNLRARVEAGKVLSEIGQPSSETRLSPLTEHLSIHTIGGSVHPDRIPQIGNTADSDFEEKDSEPETSRATLAIQSTERFMNLSKKATKALNQKACVLSRTRSGKIPVKPLPNKQRNRLQAISKDTLTSYLNPRK